MCSFLIFNGKINNIDYVNHFLKFRGPDYTSVDIFNNFHFIHNLLSITGETTYQPFVDKDNQIVTFYNGEIYNYKDFSDYKSDGCCLIDLYKKYGFDFIKHLDGEFALVLFDFKINRFCISTDTFSTKPLWYSIENNKLGISSYKSGLIRAGLTNCIKLLPNTTKIFHISNLKFLEERRVFEFDFKQYKTNYDDWLEAFIMSVKKRSSNNKIFVGLSSGYDSGSICAILNYLNVEYETYTIIGSEDKKTIDKRLIINNKKSHVFENISDEEQQNIKTYLTKNCENYDYEHVPDRKGRKQLMSYLCDDASIGLSYINNIASNKKFRIYLSGTGADEISSDYGFKGRKKSVSSCFGGKYPDNLLDIVSNNPNDDVIWKSFYGHALKDFIYKEEIVGGVHGIECRYPFLDKKVVQEFLWLSKDLKNKTYKGCIDFLLNKFDYPYNKDFKTGFNI